MTKFIFATVLCLSSFAFAEGSPLHIKVGNSKSQNVQDLVKLANSDACFKAVLEEIQDSKLRLEQNESLQVFVKTYGAPVLKFDYNESEGKVLLSAQMRFEAYDASVQLKKTLPISGDGSNLENCTAAVMLSFKHLIAHVSAEFNNPDSHLNHRKNLTTPVNPERLREQEILRQQEEACRLQGTC